MNINMTKRDYYEVLGVARTVDDAELKRAYRTLAMKYHPDKNPGDLAAAEKMKELNEAYAVLSNAHKRQLYDTYGHAGLEGYSQDDIFRGVDFGSIFSDLGFGGGIFEQFFSGGKQRARGRQKGEDLRYDLDLTLEEAAAGAEKTIRLSKAESCPKCHGTGAAPGGRVTCEQCRGTGQIVSEKRSGYSVFRQISVCGLCRGSGQVIKEKCDQCLGKGMFSTTKQIEVKVPQGAESGMAVQVVGEGGPGGPGAAAGDLYVVLNVKKHPVFQREGDDLYLKAEVGMVEAALGGKSEVPGLAGRLEVEVPEGTQNGQVIRLTGEGMPRSRGRGKGDLYVVMNVLIPTNLSDKAKELLQQLGALGSPSAVAAKPEERGASSVRRKTAKGRKPLAGARKIIAGRKAKR